MIISISDITLLACPTLRPVWMNLVWSRDGTSANHISRLSSITYYRWLVPWRSGRTLVFGRQAFAVLRSTNSWQVTTYVGKPSAAGQPTRPTQPFILSGSINEEQAATWCCHHKSVEAPSGECERRLKAGMVLFAG